MRIVAAAVAGLTLCMALAGPVSAASEPHPEGEAISKLFRGLHRDGSNGMDTLSGLPGWMGHLAGVTGVTATSGAFEEHEVAKPLVGGGVVEVFANKGWQDTGFSLPPYQRDTGWILRTKGVWCFDTAVRGYATRDANARKDIWARSGS
ncbi:hypothetical protein [Herbidospora sp. NBRC 101105]|uniref:hypothetical protein n=1 Tax=Herbidospora sp. NBRC 101105 TaxID=3032195 RepID=UPI0024A52CF7|nr:hypothetical protein [Herbidospora sp. NBRC 101105]GLX98552.1 hypothetical protein Hesp01_65020 [Herbidospora sp. NBRC 101105]